MRRVWFVGVLACALTALTAVPGDSFDTGPRDSDDTRTAAPPSDPGATLSPDPDGSPISPAPTTEPVYTCQPTVPLVDPLATEEARCLAERLDQWQSSGLYGVGQQLNVSSRDYLQPINQLDPDLPALVGFDLQELDESEQYQFSAPPLSALLRLNSEGVILTASWHTVNPKTGLSSSDRSWQDLGALLTPGNGVYNRFWADVDRKLELLRRLQTGDDGQFPPAAVLFRPLHEANGDWFWWGQGVDPTAYKQVYAQIQERAAAAGVHNIVWGWSANAVNNERILDPLMLIPDRVDVAGIDSYERVDDKQSGAPTINLEGLTVVTSRTPRIAITEVGPHGSIQGDWDPGKVARSALQVGSRPAYVMFWFDDGDGADGYTGKKQIGSLRNGRLFLSLCDAGACPLQGGPA